MDRRSILVVDDDEMTRVLLRQALSRESYTLLEAEDGREALALFSEHLPDLVLLDVELPKLNGFEVCKLIRASAEGRDVPVVMITGMDDTASIEQAYRLGATDFIAKPINWSLIGHHLRYVIRSSHHYVSLKESERRLEHAQQIARMGYWEFDQQQDRLLFSRQLTRMFALPGSQFEHGMDYLLGLTHHRERLHLKAVFRQALADGQPFQLDIRVIPPTDPRVMHVHLQGQRQPGGQVLSGIMQDVSELKKSQERLTHVAHHDALTDLPNRILFQQQLERAILRAERSKRKVGLLFVDLDRFKNINDSLGHDMGDALLREVAGRIRGAIRQYDTVARLGGDEFAIILDVIEHERDAVQFTQRLMVLFEQPFYLHGRMLYAEASIGISFYPDNGTTPEQLLRNADTAMYQAKRSEQNQFAFYSNELTEITTRRWSLENDLRLALDRQSFVLLYQPKVDPVSGRIAGVEALLRWQREEPPSVSPAEFIPVAEDTGLIIPLGKWVLEQAIGQLGAWRGTPCEGLPIAVNVSGRQLLSREFTAFIDTELRREGISAELLELEITEDYLIPDNREGTCQDTLKELSALGIKMAIDDFGTGYSSLSQLKSLPISTLKIDKSFVQDVPGDLDDVAIVKSIISLAKHLQLQVVAEGVETAEQLACIRSYGCDLVQGYFYSRPVPPEQILALVQQHGSASALSPLPSPASSGR